METALDILDYTLTTARALGADAADAALYNSADLSVSCRNGQQEQLERAENTALSLRVWVGASPAMVSSSDVSRDALKIMVERAVAMARLAPPDPFATLADAALLARDIPDLDLYDAAEPTPEMLLEQCLAAENAALSTPGITNSEGADAGFSTTRVALATSHGFAQMNRTSHTALSVSVLAGTGTEMERDYDVSSTRFLSDLTAPEILGRNAAVKALKRLHPRKIPTQNLPVFFDPRIAKSLLGNFLNAINGAGVARGTSFLKNDMGAALFPKTITILDDPHRSRGLGSRPFDGEGVKNARRTLVENGVLKSWLLDTRTANQLGLTSTGHAARGISSPPSPSATNVHIEPGTHTPQELMAQVGRALYITETFGMGVNLVTGDYSQGAAGFMIENGEITHPVSEITIAGNLREMFANLTPANDLNFRYAANAPTLLVANMTIAGA